MGHANYRIRIVIYDEHEKREPQWSGEHSSASASADGAWNLWSKRRAGYCHLLLLQALQQRNIICWESGEPGGGNYQPRRERMYATEFPLVSSAELGVVVVVEEAVL